MSIENRRTRESSRFIYGEDRRGPGEQPSPTVQRTGGVSGDSMSGRATEETRETCPCGEQAPTGDTTPATEKAAKAWAGVGVLHSSEEVPVTGMERRRGSWAQESEAKRERGDGPKGILTPTVPETATGVRKLQRTLYRQAKSKPKWKAWSLYGDVCRREVLEAALRQVITKGGAPGVDGMGVEGLKADANLRERWLTRLEAELRAKTYRSQAVRRVYILKDDGKQRPLGIPTVRDRVVQTAVVILLLPIFEADFHENSFAYRPKRRAQQAMDAIKTALLSGRREVVDADLSGYFDTIPHAALMRLVKGRVSDGSMARSGRYYPHVEPSPKSCSKLQEGIREATERSTYWKEPRKVFAQVNRQVRGWIGYFHYANSAQVFNKMQERTQQRMRRWLWKKHAKTRGKYAQAYSNQELHEHYGLIKFPLHTTWQRS